MTSQARIALTKPRISMRAPDGEVRKLAPPARVRIPLRVPGQPAPRPTVAVGAQVKAGEALALTPTRAAVHATVAGRVARIAAMHAPDGREIQGVEIVASDQQEWVRAHGIASPAEASWEELTDTLVGLGAASPWKPKSAQELMVPDEQQSFHTVLIMGIEREPELAVQRRYLSATPPDLVDGLRTIRVLAGAAARVRLLVPASLRESLAGELVGFEVEAVSERYPESHWRLVLARCTGVRNTTVAKAREAGILVMSAEEVALAGRSLREGLPRTAKLVTVMGKGLAQPVTVETVVGAPIEHVLKGIGVEVAEGDRVILGGPWQGHAQFDLQAPITPATDGLTIIPAGEVVSLEENPCINCGRCTRICPVRIQVGLVARLAEFGHMEDAYAGGAHACIECGLCAFVCPARRPLQQYIRFAVLKHEDCEVRDAQGDPECLDSKLPTDHELPSAPRGESWTAERR